MKKPIFITKIFLTLSFLFTFESCREPALDVAELNRTNVESYSDLFRTFWDTMNNDYNHFNEEAHNWDDVYKEYAPKFNALTTFNKEDADPALAKKEAHLAFKYFAEILTNKILDVHFSLAVFIPLPSSDTYESKTFHRDTKYTYTEKDGFSAYYTYTNPRTKVEEVSKNIQNKLITNHIYNTSPILSGFLKENSEIMYIQLSEFNIVNKLTITSKDFPVLKYLESPETVDQSYFDNFKSLDLQKGQELENLVKNNLNEFKYLISNIISSNEYKSYLTSLDSYNNDESYTKIQETITTLTNYIKNKKENFYNNQNKINYFIEKYNSSNSSTNNQKISINEIRDNYNKVFDLLRIASNFSDLNLLDIYPYKEYLDIDKKLANSLNKLDGYTKIFNPITNGKAKKIILDLRGNGGGAVVDSHLFIDRFITKQKIWGYERTKEGNGRFNYSPWVPNETKPHSFGLKNNIPIVILIDKGSASMSEACTLMIRSQGAHVTVIGDNSAGALAGLGPEDDFNGGNLMSNGYLEFYMPLMAFKNKEGKIIESIGVTPDIKVIPTQEQVDNMGTTGYDPAFEAALKVVNK